MKLFHRILAAAAFLSASFAVSAASEAADAPSPKRNIRLFAYERDNRMFYAWNADGLEWHTIDHGWLSSDYGTWGAE